LKTLGIIGGIAPESTIAGGTELPLLIREDSWACVRFLNTMQIHAERAVAQMLA